MDDKEVHDQATIQLQAEGLSNTTPQGRRRLVELEKGIREALLPVGAPSIQRMGRAEAANREPEAQMDISDKGVVLLRGLRNQGERISPEDVVTRELLNTLWNQRESAGGSVPIWTRDDIFTMARRMQSRYIPWVDEPQVQTWAWDTFRRLLNQDFILRVADYREVQLLEKKLRENGAVLTQINSEAHNSWSDEQVAVELMNAGYVPHAIFGTQRRAYEKGTVVAAVRRIRYE